MGGHAKLFGNVAGRRQNRWAELDQPFSRQAVSWPGDGDGGHRLTIRVKNRRGDRVDAVFLFLLVESKPSLANTAQVFEKGIGCAKRVLRKARHAAPYSTHA